MEWNKVLEEIDEKYEWKKTLNRDIPLFLQNNSDLEIKRVVQDLKILGLPEMEEWVNYTIL